MNDPNSHQSGKTYAEHQVVELIRTIAWEDFGLEVNGDSIREMVQDIYSAGGSDGVQGLLAIMETAPNVPLHLVHLYAQAEKGAARRNATDSQPHP